MAPFFKALVVCPTWKRPNCIKKWLYQIAKTTDLNQYAVAVINNGGDAETRRIVSDYLGSYRGVCYLETNRNVGIPAALNLGIQNFSESEQFLVTTEDDAFIFTPGWLDKLIAIHKNNPQIGLILTEHYQDRILEQTVIENPRVAERITYVDENVLGQVKFFNRNFKDQFGYFREDYGLYGFEDSDMCYRVHFAGLQIATVSKSIVNCCHGRVDEEGKFLAPIGDKIPDGGIEKQIENGLADENTLPKGHAKLMRFRHLYAKSKNLTKLEYPASSDAFVTVRTYQRYYE